MIRSSPADRLLAAAAVALALSSGASASAQAPVSRTRVVPLQRPVVAPAQPPAAVSGPAASVGAGMNGASQRLSDALRQIHMTACAATAQRAADFLMEGQEASFTVQPLGPDPDRWPVVITLETRHPAAGRTRLSTIVVSSGAGCVGLYQQTIYWPEPCAVVREKVFTGFTGDRVLLDAVHVAESGAALQVFTMPAGAGCVSIKKELFR